MMELGRYDIVLLYSGGLDSSLSARLLRIAGLKVLAVQFVHPFGKGLWNPQERLVYDENFDIDILYTPVDEEYLRLVENPPHGRGSNANTCIDCRIYFLRRAKTILKLVEAKLIATGEVLGQRPMSQNLSAIKMIERESGLERKIFRPLSAGFFPPTEPDISTLTSFAGFPSLKGRSRKPQINLAKNLGLEIYQTPAGGCLLTDPGYSRRFLDAIAHGEGITFELTQILKLGRHFRIGGRRLVVSRSEMESKMLVKFFSEGKTVVRQAGTVFPVALMDFPATGEQMELALSIVARYCLKKAEKLEFLIEFPDGRKESVFSDAMDQQCVEKFLV